MNILHCVTDDKFIDGAISLYDQDTRVKNSWAYFTNVETTRLKYIKSNKVKIISLAKFSSLVDSFDAVILHSLPSLPAKQIKMIPSNIILIWYAWGYDIYEGQYPLLKLPLFLPKTLDVYNEITCPKSLLKLLKRKIKHIICSNEYESILSRIDYFSGVFPYEYDLLKNKFTFFRAMPLDFYYASTNFFIKDRYSSDISNCKNNILVGNSANITGNHLDALSFVKENVSISRDDNIIIPLSYGGSAQYVDVVKQCANQLFNQNANILTLETYLPADKYLDIISNCKIAIFAHVRQQASDNIFYQLLIGAKVYMTAKSQAYQYLKGMGLNIFSMEFDYKTVNTQLTNDEIFHNRKILTKYYCISANIGRVYNINTVLLNK